MKWDFFTDLVFDLRNTVVFWNFMANLDAFGEGIAQLNTLGPLSSEFVGLKMYYAYAVNTYPWGFASNPVAIEIVP